MTSNAENHVSRYSKSYTHIILKDHRHRPAQERKTNRLNQSRMYRSNSWEILNINRFENLLIKPKHTTGQEAMQSCTLDTPQKSLCLRGHSEFQPFPQTRVFSAACSH